MLALYVRVTCLKIFKSTKQMSVKDVRQFCKNCSASLTNMAIENISEKVSHLTCKTLKTLNFNSANQFQIMFYQCFSAHKNQSKAAPIIHIVTLLFFEGITQ